MRLSDAIATGRTLIHASSGLVFDVTGNFGCAIGMALSARGVRRDLEPLTVDEYISLVPEWAWATFVQCFTPPCTCAENSEVYSSVAIAITHLFDMHVFGHCDWTLDQLIDWVRSVEPEEAPQLTETLVATEASHKVVHE
jgi:hypothetical protein